MFQAIVRHATARSPATSKELRDLSAKLFDNKRPAAAVLCLDHWFSKGSYSFDGLNPLEIADILFHFQRYAKYLHDVALNRDSWKSKSVQTLFGIEVSNENVLCIRRHTFLGTCVTTHRTPVLQYTKDGYMISNSILSEVFRTSLCLELGSRIRDEEARCRNLSVFSPCLSFAINNECCRPNCADEHRSVDTFTRETYNQRLRIHLLQFSICNLLHDVQEGDLSIAIKEYVFTFEQCSLRLTT